MNRRELLAGSLGGAALVGLGPVQAQGRTPRRFMVDALAIGGAGSVDGPEVLAAGMDALVLDMTIFPRAQGEATAALSAWNTRVAEDGAALSLIRKGADFQAARDAGKLGVVIACQDASILGPSVISYSDRNLEALRAMHAAGLRILQLTHNERTGAGDGFMEPQDGGLSLLGARVVEEMGRLGGLIDLSHCSERTTIEAIRLSAGPIAVTHAGCRALHPSLRNKTDEAIRALADKGGFFGVFMMSRWLTDRDTSSVEDVVDHIDHVVKIAGIEHVGIGTDSDLNGYDDMPPDQIALAKSFYKSSYGFRDKLDTDGFDDPARFYNLTEALVRRGYSDAHITAILGGNFRRLLGQVWLP